MESPTLIAWRGAVDVAAVIGALLLILDAPFALCRRGQCLACASGWLFDPPTFGDGRLLCAVNLEQLTLRFLALAAAWYLVRRAPSLFRQ